METHSSTLQEFKEFAMKGNMVDLAVGVIIGAAFGSVVTSFVNDIIMPVLSLVTGGLDFSDKLLILKAATETSKAVTWNYGMFITALINFIIVAFAIYLIIKQVNRFRKEKAPETPPAPTTEEKLLIEIRDLLKEKHL